ncbi:MAG TPA: phospho-sugar mutase, partial [Streptosporangiaceae bacterium]|nr:phospho-sugar mutase [Streptosporangiaceae bacterium]
LEATYGVHATTQVTVPTTRPAAVMARLRAEPPQMLAAQAVIAIADLTGGTSELPSADVLTYGLANGRVVIRPSGTEPKIKAYLELVEPVAADGLTAARARAAELMDPLRAAVSDLLAG